MRAIFVLQVLLLAGCGPGLTQTQLEEYETLGTEQETLRSKISAAEDSVRADFLKLGRYETRHKAKTAKALSCGFKLHGKSLGPLPFRHKRGYVALFKKTGNQGVSGRVCHEYRLKVKR